jgi:membrane-associated phospholipid phosphatase
VSVSRAAVCHGLVGLWVMRFSRIAIVLASALLFAAGIAAAEPTEAVKTTQVQNEPPARLHPFSLLGRNISDAFWGRSTYWHLGAFASTVAMVKTPADRKIQDYFQEKNPLGQPFAFAMLRTGDASSFVLSVAFYGVGYFSDSAKLTGAGASAFQAVLINGAFVGSLKIITARHRPGDHNSADDFFPAWDERVQDFKFRTSYPSGHTSTSFAFVASMHAYYHEHKWIPWVGYPIATAIGVGMVEGDYHWTSEVVAGAIIGTVIGYTIGTNFRTEFDRRSNAAATVAGDKRDLAFILSPSVGGGRYGLAATWYW